MLEIYTNFNRQILQHYNEIISKIDHFRRLFSLFLNPGAPIQWFKLMEIQGK